MILVANAELFIENAPKAKDPYCKRETQSKCYAARKRLEITGEFLIRLLNIDDRINSQTYHDIKIQTSLWVSKTMVKLTCIFEFLETKG